MLIDVNECINQNQSKNCKTNHVSLVSNRPVVVILHEGQLPWLAACETTINNHKYRDFR